MKLVVILVVGYGDDITIGAYSISLFQPIQHNIPFRLSKGYIILLWKRERKLIRTGCPQTPENELRSSKGGEKFVCVWDKTLPAHNSNRCRLSSCPLRAMQLKHTNVETAMIILLSAAAISILGGNE
jgi:hypothetical protein